jgi:hypothetical protein
MSESKNIAWKFNNRHTVLLGSHDHKAIEIFNK